MLRAPYLRMLDWCITSAFALDGLLRGQQLVIGEGPIANSDLPTPPLALTSVQLLVGILLMRKGIPTLKSPQWLRNLSSVLASRGGTTRIPESALATHIARSF